VKIFNLPDLGEGLPEAEIAEWHVKIGDEVQVDQPLLSMETAKALVEIPSPYSGRIVQLFGQPGDILKTGAPLVEFDSLAADQTTKETGTVAGQLEESNAVIHEPILNLSHSKTGAVKATPHVRALAKQLGVDLNTVVPENANGIMTTHDVELAAKDHPLSDGFIALHSVRRAMAETMSHSKAEVVPVTVMEDAVLIHWQVGTDITVRLIQALIKACQEEPALNAWFDGKTLSRKLFSEINIGIALDTDLGLWVPVIHRAESLTPAECRREIDGLKSKVNSREIPREQLRGATILLSNFGKFQGRYATPVVVPPTVAILGVGKQRDEVVALEGKVQVYPVLPLSLTVDHRAVTGGEAARFLSVVINFLQTDR